VLKLATLSLAALLISVSPTFAKKAPEAPARVCLSPEGFIKTAPDGYSLIASVEGEELARLDKLRPGTLPDGSDLILVFGVHGSEEVYVMLVFKKNCILGKGGITPNFLAKRFAPTDDGKI
jgi:hypothetical protein